MQKKVISSKAGSSRTRFLVECAVMAAILCVLCPITFPMGPIPVTLSLFAILLGGIILGWKKGLVAVLVYVLLGVCGLPVFAGSKGGLPVLVGPTGGYIWSYFLVVVIVGLITSILKDSSFTSFIITIGACILGVLACYGVGILQYMNVTKMEFMPALAVCVYPFAPFDFFKLVLASMVGIKVKMKLDKAR